MALNSSNWTSNLFSNFSSKGFTGKQVKVFCKAVSTGSVAGIKGKPFIATGIGMMPGIGKAQGNGVIGIIAALVKTAIIGECAQAGLIGTAVPDVADAIAQTLVTQMKTAKLTAITPPLFNGNAFIIPGSIIVIPQLISLGIMAAGASSGFIGPQWASFANAIGNGTQKGFLTATGKLKVSGQFAGPVPPGPIPGAGVGPGILT